MPSVATGTLTIGTGAIGTTHSVTGLSFAPKAVILVYSGRATAGQGEATHTFGCGIFTGTSARRVYTAASRHAHTAANGRMAWRNDAAVALLDPATGSFTAMADVDAMLSDGFRLVIDDVFPANLLVGYLAIGGDEVSVDLVDFTSLGATGNQDIATAFALDTGLDDKLVVCLGGINAAANTGTGWAEFGIGAAAGDTIAQAVAFIATQDASDPSVTWAYGRTGQLGVFSTAADGIDNTRFSLTAWLSTGFRLNYTSTGANIRYSALVLKGGRYFVGDITTSTGTSNQVEATPYLPKALLLASVCRALSAADTTTAPAEISVGAASDPSSRWAAGLHDKDAAATSDVGIAFRDDALYVNQSSAATIAVEGLADLVSFDATPSFTWVMDDADPSGAFAWYAGIADAPGAAKPWHHYAQQHRRAA